MRPWFEQSVSVMAVTTSPIFDMMDTVRHILGMLIGATKTATIAAAIIQSRRVPIDRRIVMGGYILCPARYLSRTGNVA